MPSRSRPVVPVLVLLATALAAVGVMFAGAGAALAHDGNAAIDEPVFTVFSGVQNPDTAADVARAAGGRLVVFAPDTGIALVDIDDGGVSRLRADRRVRFASRGPLETRDLARLSGRPRIIAGAWHRDRLLRRNPPPPKPDGDPLIDDALTPPLPAALQVSAMSAGAPELGGTVPGPRPAGAESYNTSEYMAGKISLSVFLIESSAASTEDWDATLEGNVYSKVMQAASSLASMYPASELSFVIHAFYGRTDARVRVACEPIAHPARSNDGSNCYENGWVSTILANFGYSAADMWSASRNYADAVRAADDTDWSINVFVANSLADADGKFGDGRFGYAWIGGPHIVLTYDNDGWGISRFDMVLRHETHHSFFAYDEYASSACTCGQKGGYLAAPNDNCQNGCLTTATCVMINNGPEACAATRAQVAATDADADGTADILEATPGVTATLTTAPTCAGGGRVTGTGGVGFVPNVNTYYGGAGNAISILEVSSVQHRVDGGAWTSSTATDGAFDAWSEDYQIDLALTPGAHTVDVRAVDSRGNTSSVVAVPVTRPGAASPVTTSVRVARIGASTARLTWSAAAGAAGYKVRSGATPAAALAAAGISVAGTSHDDTGKATKFYTVTTVNSCGDEVP